MHKVGFGWVAWWQGGGRQHCSILGEGVARVWNGEARGVAMMGFELNTGWEETVADAQRPGRPSGAGLTRHRLI